MTDVDADTAARAAALDPQRSLLLQAPAGSGKTTVLTQRFLRLLSCVDEPEQILAITFTRKAAAEMRERVLGALFPATGTTASPLVTQLRDAALQRARAQGWDLLELPARLRIQTIDSLNHEIARSMPVLGRTDGNLQVVDHAQPLYRRAARQTLLDAEAEPDYQSDADLILRRLDNSWSRAEGLLAEMLARRAQWLPSLLTTGEAQLPDLVEQSIEGILRDALQEGLQLFDGQRRKDTIALAIEVAAQREQLEHEDDGWRCWFDPAAMLSGEPLHLDCWRSVARMALTQKGTLKRRLTKTDGVPTTAPLLKKRYADWVESLGLTAGAEAWLHLVLSLPPAKMSDEDRAALLSLARLLKLAASELKLTFRTMGRVDHAEIASTARQALRDPEGLTDLGIHHATTLAHLLVDEFQDTSIEQFGLIEALTAGWQQGDGRSLFIVGDPMQSIYLFRSAEVGLFLRARDSGIGELLLDARRLTRNFRSAPAVVDWVNTAFDVVFPARDDLRTSAVRFLPADAARQELVHPRHGVQVVALAGGEREVEAREIASRIAEVRAHDPAATVAVLILARSHAPPIMAALRDRGIAARGIDLAPLGQRPAIRDIVALTRALLHPGDRSAWLSVLRAPFCGLCLADLHVLAGDADRAGATSIPELLAGEFTALGADGQQRLARCAPLLTAAAAARGAEPLARSVQLLWSRLGGPAACESLLEREEVTLFLEALAQQDAAGESIDAQFVQELAATLKAGGDAGMSNAVEILTIHKSKGLEWDVVFLPGLGRAGRQDDQPLLRWLELPRREGGVDLLMAALSIGDPERDPLNVYISHLQKQRIRNERARLAYVAATRARRELHLLGHAPRPADGGAPSPKAGSLLHTLWPSVESAFTQFAAEEAADVPPAVVPTREPPRFTRLPADWQMPPLPTLASAPRFSVGAEDTQLQPEFSWVGLTARATGTLIHAELERRGQQAPWSPATAAHYRARLQQLGVAAAEAATAAQRIVQVLTRVGADPLAAWIFDPAHSDAANELKLSGLLDGRLVNLVIDRSFTDASGDRWVIDYKTGGHQGGDLQSFLANEEERYRPQLQQYRKLVSRLGPEPVRTALYFPLLGELRELSW